jgi:hypothetical protein
VEKSTAEEYRIENKQRRIVQERKVEWRVEESTVNESTA